MKEHELVSPVGRSAQLVDHGSADRAVQATSTVLGTLPADYADLLGTEPVQQH